jgi:RNA polymerase sigma-70 factor (ECF subfamily)
VYKKYGSFKGRSSEKTWITRVAVNVCKDLLRSSWIKRVFLAEDIRTESIYHDIGDKLVEMEDSKILFSEVIQLSPSQKDVIILYYYQGFDTIEISKTLGVPESTVRTRLFRAREALKKRINGRIEYHD